MLVAPPEIGGRGMAPSEVGQLTLAQLENFLRARSQQISEDWSAAEAYQPDPDKLQAARDDLAARRAYFKGEGGGTKEA